jgi:hypothetical protein
VKNIQLCDVIGEVVAKRHLHECYPKLILLDMFDGTMAGHSLLCLDNRVAVNKKSIITPNVGSLY